MSVIDGKEAHPKPGVLRDERGGADTLIITLLVVPLLLFLSFISVPFFVYIMKANHLNMTANHALKEAESIGYVSPSVIDATRVRLSSLGLGSITQAGVVYPSFAGSTTNQVLRDDVDPTVTLVITYPAPNLTRMLSALGRQGAQDEQEGFYRVVLHGRSEAYENVAP
jgi:hypothetical protein